MLVLCAMLLAAAPTELAPRGLAAGGRIAPPFTPSGVEGPASDDSPDAATPGGTWLRPLDSARGERGANPVSPSLRVPTVPVPGGTFAPLYGLERTQSSLPVRPFRAGVRAVTTAQFLAFLAANPSWRSPAPALADERYLQALDGPADAPMVNVSWFAARAWCAWAGGRLPTTLEWEYLAAADEHTADASRDPAFVQRILEWYSKPVAAAGQGQGSPRNVYGAEALHGLVWEWTEDFNAAFLTTDNRQDGDKNAAFLCGSGSIGSARREDYAAFMRYAFRSSLTARTSLPSLGFRCVFEVSP